MLDLAGRSRVFRAPADGIPRGLNLQRVVVLGAGPGGPVDMPLGLLAGVGYSLGLDRWGYA